MGAQSAPTQIFCSSAPEDIALYSQLHNHLRILERQDVLGVWHPRFVTAGTDWAKAIDEHIASASIILLLISSDFFASDYCYGIEMQTALERHQAKEALVIPIVLRPVDWRAALPSLAHLKALPANGRPITEWHNHKGLRFLELIKLAVLLNGGTPCPSNQTHFLGQCRVTGTNSSNA